MLQLAERVGALETESAFDVLNRAAELVSQGKSVINLGIGQPDFQPPEHVVEAANRALRDGHHGYTPPQGIRPLREAVASDIHRRIGVEVDPDCIVIQPGGKPTLFFACLLFGDLGTEILYPDPGFPIYPSAIRFSGAKAIPYPLHEERGFAWDPEEVLSLINMRTRLIILNSPSNPTGGVLDRESFDRLVEGLLRFPHVAILSDEIYSRMLYDGETHTSLLAYPELRDRAILLDGWSKTFAMTGWRLGYGVWPEPLVDPVRKLCVNDHSCVNAATQWAGIEALNGPQGQVQAMMRAFTERRKLLVDGLNEIPGFRCEMPMGAFYAFPNIAGTQTGSQELQERLLYDAGVALISGTSFGNRGEGYLRISYANSLNNIEAALERIRNYLIKKNNGDGS